MGGNMGTTNTTNIIVEKTYTDPKTGKFTKGNPGGGRPVGSVSIVEGIKKKLLEIEPVNKKTYLELFLNTYFKNSIKNGDATLIRDMINRIDGMPKQPVEHDGEVKIESIVTYVPKRDE